MAAAKKKQRALTPEQLALIEEVSGTPDTRDSSKYLPYLKVQQKAIVKGKTVIAADGTWSIIKDKELLINANHVTGRVLAVRYRFKQEGVGGKLIGTTVFEKEPTGEFKDSLGGVKLGKFYPQKDKDGEVTKKLNAKEEAYNKNIKWEMYIYMLISATGTDADGKKTKVKDELVTFTRTGGAAVRFQNDYLSLLTQNRKLKMFNFDLELTEPEKPKGSSYFAPAFTVKGERVLDMDVDLPAIKRVNDLISEQNAYVEKKHINAAQSDDDLANDMKE